MKNFFLNDKNILILILINASIIFVSGFDFQHQWEKTIDIIDNFITILFLIELIIKLKHFGKESYFSSYWNVFDFILVLFSIPPLLFSFIGVESDFLSFILIFRVMRVFKSFRFLKFIPNINHIVIGIKRAIKTSVLIVFSFFIYVFIVGIVSFHLFGIKSPEHFGSPLKSMYSVFKIFTIDGWYEIPEQIVENLSPVKSFFVLFYFVCILLSGGILGLSLVNSIFVEAMVSDNNDDINEKIDEIQQKLDLLLKEKEKKV